MANRGEGKSQKSISSPKVRYFGRKEDVFTPRARAGAHSRATSVPLSFVLKTLLGVADNAREAKAILLAQKILVNGVARKSMGFAVGLFDIVEIKELKKKYRALLDGKGRLVMKEIDAKGADFKISKVVKKRKISGGKTMITTSDGFNIEVGKEKVHVDDSVKISIPEMKLLEVLSLGKGNAVFIIGGTHVGEISMIEEVTQGSLQREKFVTLEGKEKTFQTVTRNVFVVGKGKPEIEALKSA